MIINIVTIIIENNAIQMCIKLIFMIINIIIIIENNAMQMHITLQTTVICLCYLS